jgi:nucleoside-diphosphate-sugar epimerase
MNKLIKSPSINHLIVTGANGYIGKKLVKIAVESGFSVTLLGRHEAPESEYLKTFRWSIGEPLPADLHKNNFYATTTAIIHLAHDWKTSSVSSNDLDNHNINATKVLLESGRQFGIKRFVFASSQSARIDAPNVYGRVKWQIEQKVNGADTVSARIGLVYGGAKSGMFGLICKLIKLPVLPMITPNRMVQPIHLNEVCEGLLRLTQSNLSGHIGLASNNPISFGGFLRKIAIAENGATLSILPIPLNLALFGAYLTRLVPGIPNVDKERILGLAGTNYSPTINDLEALGLEINSSRLDSSTTATGNRGLLAEAYVLLHYILGTPPPFSLMIHYVKAIKNLNNHSAPLGLSRLIIIFPVLLCFYEPLNSTHILAKRLSIATTLAESSPEGWDRFFNTHKNNRLYRLARLALKLAGDIFILPMRAFLSREKSYD